MSGSEDTVKDNVARLQFNNIPIPPDNIFILDFLFPSKASGVAHLSTHSLQMASPLWQEVYGQKVFSQKALEHAALVQQAAKGLQQSF